MASNRELSQFASKVVVNDTTGTISFGTTVTDLVVSGVSTFNNVVIGGASTSLVVTGDAHISGAVTAASFHGDGESLTGLNASNITSGLIPSSVLPAVMVNDISGNAATATKWQTARTFAIVGDGSGSVSIDGSANVSLNLSVTGGDADTLDNLNSTQFLRSDQSDTMSGTLTANFFAGNGSALTALNASNITSGTLSNDRLPATLTKDISGNAATATNATSAGNADTLDGINSTQFLRSDQSDSMSGTLSATAFVGDGSGLTNLNASNITSGTISASRLPPTMSGTFTGNADTASSWTTARTISVVGDANGSVSIDGSSDVTLSLDVTSSSSADNSLRLNGLLSSQFLRSDESDSMTGTLTATAFVGNGASLTNLNASSISSGTISNSRLPSTINKNISGNAATATNADKLDNLNSTQFLRSDQSDTMSGTLTATAFSGSGASLTSLNASNISSGTISDARLPSSITSNITGNAATATKWQTARTITLSGDASGSVSIDGSANKTLSVTVNDDSHNHTIANIDGLQSALDGKASTTNNFVESTTVDTIVTTTQAGYDNLVSSGQVDSSTLYLIV